MKNIILRMQVLLNYIYSWILCSATYRVKMYFSHPSHGQLSDLQRDMIIVCYI